MAHISTSWVKSPRGPRKWVLLGGHGRKKRPGDFPSPWCWRHPWVRLQSRASVRLPTPVMTLGKGEQWRWHLPRHPRMSQFSASLRFGLWSEFTAGYRPMTVWTTRAKVDTLEPQNEAQSYASRLTPPNWPNAGSTWRTAPAIPNDWVFTGPSQKLGHRASSSERILAGLGLHGDPA